MRCFSILNYAIFCSMFFNFERCDLLTMFQKIAKHRANDASNNVHRPPLPAYPRCWSPSSQPPLLAQETCSPPWAQPGWPGNPKKSRIITYWKMFTHCRSGGDLKSSLEKTIGTMQVGRVWLAKVSSHETRLSWAEHWSTPRQQPFMQDLTSQRKPWKTQFGYKSPLLRPAMMELKLIQSREDILSPPSSSTASLLWKYNYLSI